MLTLQEHSCWWLPTAHSTTVRAVDENAQLAGEIRAWLLQVMRDTGLSVTDWAQKANVARTTIARPVKAGYPFVTSSRTLAKLAKAAGVEAPDIGRPADERIVPLLLSVRYKVQAGHWYEMDAAEEPDQISHAVTPDPRFANWPQWLEEVRGDSANKRIQPGQYVHVVDAIEMGYAPQQGNWVVVERRRNQGAERERSLKQVELRPDGRVELWPRSTNPRWNEPLRLNSGGPRIVAVSGETAPQGEEVEVEIVGLVIGVYDPFL